MVWEGDTNMERFTDRSMRDIECHRRETLTARILHVDYVKGRNVLDPRLTRMRYPADKERGSTAGVDCSEEEVGDHICSGPCAHHDLAATIPDTEAAHALTNGTSGRCNLRGQHRLECGTRRDCVGTSADRLHQTKGTDVPYDEQPDDHRADGDCDEKLDERDAG